MSVAQLKKKSGGNLNKLQERLNKMKEKGGNNKGNDYWKISVDSSGEGVAEIRLLPAIETEDMPFTTILDYGIGVFNKEAGKKLWYIHRSLESIGKKDPVKDEFWACMNQKTTEHKEMAKQIRDRTSYIVWVYIISDKHAPQNNGKVMKAKLSPSIWKLVDAKINPDATAIEDGAIPTDVFDFWEGSTLKLRANNGENGMRTYERSIWMPPKPLFDNDDDIEKVYSQVKGLAFETDPSNPEYKYSYEELSAKLEKVLGRKLIKDQEEDTSDSQEDLESELSEIAGSNDNDSNDDLLDTVTDDDLDDMLKE